MSGPAFERLLPAGGTASAVDLAEEAADGAHAPDGRPHVFLNMVATLDGRAAVGGTTRPLGGEADLELLLELRAAADAVLIGTGTIRAEGYDRLVQRDARRARRRAAGRAEDPLAVLVSRSGDVPWDAGLFAAPAQPVLVYADAAAPAGVAAPVEVASPRPLPEVLADLHARGVRRLLCEGGPGLNRALFADGLVDALCLTLSATVSADDREPSIVTGGALPGLVPLRLDAVARHGDELFLRYGAATRIRHSVRVLLLDEEDRLLLFRAERPETGAAFWFPAGGGVEPDEDARAAAVREVAEETGVAGVAVGPEVWRRRHVFTWRGVRWDQRERWFLARVAHFEPDRTAMTEHEQADLTACRWWTVEELERATDQLVPRDLAPRLRALLRDGPPARPVDVGV